VRPMIISGAHSLISLRLLSLSEAPRSLPQLWGDYKGIRNIDNLRVRLGLKAV
jgi:hypothetical protein